MKTCGRCRVSKPYDAFNKHKRDGYDFYCKPCKKERHTEWRKANPEKAAAIYAKAARKQNYGITQSEYEELLLIHGSTCSLCLEDKPKLVIDHDHATGKVRGLICHKCNNGLGAFRDDVELLQKAIRYLKEYE